MKIYYTVESKQNETISYPLYSMACEDFANRYNSKDSDIILSENVRYWKGLKRQSSTIVLKNTEEVPVRRKIGF